MIFSLDRTFCTGLRCKRAASCDRWTDNLVTWAEEKEIDLENQRISVAEFADQDGNCNMWSPVGEEDENNKRT